MIKNTHLAKKRTAFFTTLIIIVAVLSACATANGAQQTMPPANGGQQGIPAFVTEALEDIPQGAIAGIGMSTFRQPHMAMQQAQGNAMTSIAMQLNSVVSIIVDNYYVSSRVESEVVLRNAIFSVTGMDGHGGVWVVAYVNADDVTSQIISAAESADILEPEVIASLFTQERVSEAIATNNEYQIPVVRR